MQFNTLQVKLVSYLLESVVRHCDGNFPPVAAHLVYGLDLVARLVLVAFQEDVDVVFEALWKSESSCLNHCYEVRLGELLTT
jgi:hypothetical protein